MNSSLPLATALPPPAATPRSSHWARGSALYIAFSVMETQAVGLLFIVLLGQRADASPASSLVLVVAMLSMYGVATLIRGARAGVKPPWLALVVSPTLYIGSLVLLIGGLIVVNPPLFLPMGSAGNTATQTLDVLAFSALFARCVFVVEQRTTHPWRIYEIALNGLRVGFGMLLFVMLAAAGSGAGAILPALALAVPLFGLSGFLTVALARHLGLARNMRPQAPQPQDSRRTWQVLWSGVGPGLLVLFMVLEYLGYYAFLGQLAAIFGAIWAGINAVIQVLLWGPNWLWKWLTTPHHPPALQATPTPANGTPQFGPGNPGTCPPGVACTPQPGQVGSGGTQIPGGSGTSLPGTGTPGTVASGGGTSTAGGQGTTPLPGTGTAQSGGQKGTPVPGGTGTPVAGGHGTPGSGTGTPVAGHGTSTPVAGSGTPGVGTGTPGTHGTPQPSLTGTPGTGTPGIGGNGVGPGTPGYGTGMPGNASTPGQPTPTPTPTPAANQAVPPNTSHSDPNIMLILLGILLILVVIALVLLLVLWLRRRGISDAAEIATARAAQRRRRTRLEGPFLNSVRAYYRTLLEEAARRGGEHARLPAETPGEYAQRLRDLLRVPDAAQDVSHSQDPDVVAILDELTSAYALERYSGVPIPEQRRTRLRSWLPRLLGALGRKQK